MLHHGTTGNLKGFRYFGYTEKLHQQYQLILIDARGHGRSDKLHEPDAYRLKNLVNDTVAVLDARARQGSNPTCLYRYITV